MTPHSEDGGPTDAPSQHPDFKSEISNFKSQNPDRNLEHSAGCPPTIIVIHPKERRSKCSVWPLRGRDGLVFWRYPNRGPESLEGYVRLGLGGPRLSMDDAGAGLLLLDGTWRWAAAMERDYANLPVRSLDAWVTAYPRTSKLFDDPAAGLATVEALYAAYIQTGRPTEGLLDHYQWREQFLALNSQRIPHADRP